MSVTTEERQEKSKRGRNWLWGPVGYWCWCLRSWQCP